MCLHGTCQIGSAGYSGRDDHKAASGSRVAIVPVVLTRRGELIGPDSAVTCLFVSEQREIAEYDSPTQAILPLQYRMGLYKFKFKSFDT